MKNRKSCLLLAMLLAVSLVLTGCGGSEQPQGGQVTPATEAVTEPAETEAPVGLGRMEGGTYTNTYAGFGCDLDESWTFYTAEELQEIPEDVQENFEDTDASEMLDKIESYTDMMAENVDMMANVNVTYGKMDMKERLAMAAVSEKEVLDATLEDKDELIATYEAAGMKVTSIENVEVTFLGESRWGIKTVAEVEGVPVFIQQVSDFRAGAYAVVVTVTSFVEDSSQAVLDLFYPVD